MAKESSKSTVKGTQPEVSRERPLIVATKSVPTPAKLNAILMAAKLQPPCCAFKAPFVCDQTPADVGNLAPPPQLAHTA